MRLATFLPALTVLLALSPCCRACTRLLYETGTGNYITARGMDWNDPTAETSLWVVPRGIVQNGGVGENSLSWTSSYGSVFLSFYDSASVDGMNEKGLVANVLYLAEADYGSPREGQSVISIGAWGQYFLDNFASVEEAVEAMQDPPFTLVSPLLPNGRPATAHISLADASGDSAIFEYIEGKLQIHHSREYTVMTNSPPFDEQLHLVKYWNHVGGDRFLPGTISAADRFVRTNYLLSSTPKFNQTNLAVGAAFSLIRSVGVPLGMEDPEHPNISMTLWRSVSDQENLILYFDSVVSPYLLWVDLKKIDFGNTVTQRIPLGENHSENRLLGEVSAEFKPSEPIKWMAPHSSTPSSDSRQNCM